MKNIIKSTLTGRLMMLVAVLSLIVVTGCKDEWDEHYDSEASGLTYQGDMMSYLNSQSQLSDFAEVVKAAGFDTDMASSQIRTLWAPVNGSFDKESLIRKIEKGDKKSVITGFIKNHMARYGLSLSSQTEKQNILLLNSKLITMTPEGTFGTANITTSNVTCKNGVIHIIDAGQPYQTNLYEQIETAHKEWLEKHPEQATNDSLISMYSFLTKYNDDSLDVNKSVYRGVDENGEKIYVDSVVIRNNTVLNSMDALIYTEDSNYYAIIPSVEAYQARYEAAKQFLVYNPYESITDSKMCDSLQFYYANMFALADCFFNVNTNTRHEQLVQDSIVSTSYKRSNWENHVYYNPYEEGGLLSNPTQKVTCSNGTAYMMNEYPQTIMDQFYKKIVTRCTATYNIDQTTNSSGVTLYTKNVNTSFNVYTLTVNDREHDINTSYLDVQPTTKAVNPYIAFKISSTLKAKYDMYLVYCPIWVNDYKTYEDALAGHEQYVGTDQDPLRPYYFRVNIYERANSGTNMGFYPTSGTAVKNPVDGSNFFTTETDQYVDTLFLGTIETQNAYYGTTSEGLLVQLQANVTSKKTVEYSREMKLCSVVLKPHEEIEETGIIIR